MEPVAQLPAGSHVRRAAIGLQQPSQATVRPPDTPFPERWRKIRPRDSDLLHKVSTSGMQYIVCRGWKSGAMRRLPLYRPMIDEMQQTRVAVGIPPVTDRRPQGNQV